MIDRWTTGSNSQHQ